MHTHHIASTEVTIGYADVHGDLLPINNDDNFCKAVSSANPLLRVFIQKRGTYRVGRACSRSAPAFAVLPAEPHGSGVACDEGRDRNVCLVSMNLSGGLTNTSLIFHLDGVDL